MFEDIDSDDDDVSDIGAIQYPLVMIDNRRIMA